PVAALVPYATLFRSRCSRASGCRRGPRPRRRGLAWRSARPRGADADGEVRLDGRGRHDPLMAATEKLSEAEAIRKAAQEAVGVGTSAPKTKPKDLRAVAREAVGDPNAVPTKDRDAYQDQDVFAPGIAKV